MTKTKRVQQRYSIEKSPIHSLKSKRKLSSLFTLEMAALVALSLRPTYRIYKDKKTGRLITQPIGLLEPVHKKLASLLSRIEPPEYLHSATKGRSYKTNASAHATSSNVIKLDLKKFYPATRFNHVFSFFKETLNCSIDVCTILTRLCTVETKNYGKHLPTGSSVSPLLSFYAHLPLFDRLNSICREADCVMTLYVDDVSVSGEKATQELLTILTKEVHSYSLAAHKHKVYKKSVPAKITGVIVHGSRLLLPNERARKIRLMLKTLKEAREDDRKPLLSSLIGRLTEAEQFDPRYKRIREKIMGQYPMEWAEIVRKRTEKSMRSKTTVKPSHRRLR